MDWDLSFGLWEILRMILCSNVLLFLSREICIVLKFKSKFIQYDLASIVESCTFIRKVTKFIPDFLALIIFPGL